MPLYKADRKPNDAYPLIVLQLGPLAKAIEDLGYRNAAVMGLEADDVIGLLARSFAQRGERVLVFSTDRDFYQLLRGDAVQVLVPKKTGGAFARVTADSVEREHGVPVAKWADFLALGGDKSDNIKPMRGMGPVTAKRLVDDGIQIPYPFSGQTDEFKRKHAKYEPAWAAIQASRRAARIPTEPADRRIAPALAAAGWTPYTLASVSAEQQFTPASQRRFESFLADRGMVSLLGLRHQFFDGPQNQNQKQKKAEEEEPCQNRRPQRPTTSRRSLI